MRKQHPQTQSNSLSRKPDGPSWMWKLISEGIGWLICVLLLDLWLFWIDVKEHNHLILQGHCYRAFSIDETKGANQHSNQTLQLKMPYKWRCLWKNIWEWWIVLCHILPWLITYQKGNRVNLQFDMVCTMDAFLETLCMCDLHPNSHVKPPRKNGSCVQLFQTCRLKPQHLLGSVDHPVIN